MLYKKNGNRPLTQSDLKPYLEFIEQKRSIPFKLRTTDGESVDGKAQEFKVNLKGEIIVSLEIRAVDVFLSWRTKDRISNYPLGFSNPILQGIDPLPSPTLIIRSNRELITLHTPN